MHGSFCFFVIFKTFRMTDKTFFGIIPAACSVFSHRIYRGFDGVLLSANLSIDNDSASVIQFA